MVNLNFQTGKQMEKVDSIALSEMSDSDINRMYRDIKSRIYSLHERLKKKYNKSIVSERELAEIEFCYLKRESEVRHSRKRAHQEYMNARQQN